MVDVYKFLKTGTKVELIQQGNRSIFKSEILSILEDRVLLAAPQNRTENFSMIEELEKLTVIFCTENGVLSGNANLLKKSVDEDKNIYISFPYNNQFCQRRENTRIPMHVPFELFLDDKTLTLKTKNISGKGLACMTKEPLPDFADKKIFLQMPSSKIELICRKVYSKEVDLGKESLFLNGVEFTEISEKDVGIIVKDCLKFQLDSKRNERLFETL